MSKSPHDQPAAHPPATRDLQQLGDAAKACRACPLWSNATQTVFGEGNPAARIMLVGEEPGDLEDRRGHPFVGPAGQILNAALEAAGIDRSTTFVTNAVKHFKWTPSGSKRLHQKPNRHEVHACFPWLLAEIEAIQPQIVVCLGATAAQALLGNSFKVTEQRGQFLPGPNGILCFATVHPSSILRAIDHESRHAELGRFIADLSLVTEHLKSGIATRASLL